MKHPSDVQLKAICHVSGPARVLAGPGSGKTFTIIQRLSYLVNEIKISPEQILCITFTKAAAYEMQSRYQSLTDVKEGQEHDVVFKTIHGICYQILKESGEYRNYSLISELNKRKIIETVLKNKGLFKELSNGIATELLDAVSRKKNAMSYLADALICEDMFDDIYKEYQLMLQDRKLLDFDDLITECNKLFMSKSACLKKWQERFGYILVDEFQDVNQTQYELIKRLALPQNNLYVVGDDDQAIYGFRGAMPSIMRHFKEDFPNARELFLSENYRSGNKIVEFAGEVIRKNKQRIEKKIVCKKTGGIINIVCKDTEREEEIKLIEDINKLTEKERSNSAVILRTNREVLRYRTLFAENNIKTKENMKKETNLFAHFIAQDMKAFLCFCREGYKRCDFLNIVNKPEMFLSCRGVVNECVTEKELMQYYSKNMDMQKKIKRLFVHYKKIENLQAKSAVRYIRKVVGYDAYLKEKAHNIHEFNEYIKIAEQLMMIMAEHHTGEKIQDFFDRMEKKYRGEFKDYENNDKTGISVITMHSAKGLEFDAVFLPDLNEGVMPGRQCMNQESVEEERRLLYVSVTRAKKYLMIYYTKERRRKPSRFIADFIPHQ